jgi:hypothetical protein
VDAAQPKVSATIIADQIRLMKQLHGEETLSKAILSLAPPLRAEIEELLPGSWCSVDAARELKVAVAEILGEDPHLFQRRIVRQGIERTLTTVWRFFMRQLSDAALTRRTPVLYSRSFDRGRLKVVRFGEGECDFELEGWPRMPEFDLIGLMSGIETILALGGRLDAHVSFKRRGAVIQLHANWRKR